MATANCTLATGELRIVGVQILPCIKAGGLVTRQLNGPDAKTRLWKVYERWSDGRSMVFDDYASQARALNVARFLARAHRVEIEPYPWVVALCRADGWTVAPTEDKGQDRKRYRYGKIGGKWIDAGTTEFDTWLACLYHAAVCA